MAGVKLEVSGVSMSRPESSAPADGRERRVLANVSFAVEDGAGYMATILREPGPIYRVRYDKVPLELVANSERAFPAKWITPSGTDITDDYVQYARPLIGNDWPAIPLIDGRQRFTRFTQVFAERRLPSYTPSAYRDSSA